MLWDVDGSLGLPNQNFQTKQPAAAHVFGTMTGDTTYLVQRWGCDEESNTGTIRLSGIGLNSDATLASISRIELSDGTCMEGTVDTCVQRCLPATIAGATPHRNVHNAVLRDGRVYYTRISRVDDAYGSRWTASWSTITLNGSPAPGQTPTIASYVFDSGRVFDTSADNDISYPVHHIYPLVMPTNNGGLAIFTSRAIPSGFVDLVSVARRSGDAAGVLGAPVQLIQSGQAGVSPPNEWGDYEGMALDPTDGNRVWITGTVGRCPTPSQADAECPTCLQPNPPPDCFFVKCFSSAVGSYTIPDHPIRTLTIVRDPTNPPPAFAVKVMPMSIDGVADQLITSAAPYTRRFGHGTSVTLMVGRDYGESYTFSKWLVNGDAVSPPPGAHEKVLTLLMDQDRTVAPVFKD